MVDIPTTAFVPVPGQANTTLVQLSPGPTTLTLAAPAPITFLTAIQTAVADNEKANTPGGTALPPPDNFRFTDLTVGVSGSVPGDEFEGTTTDITAQFLDLTPDNLLIAALNPGTFMRSDTGNDLLIAVSGRNILSAGSGFNAFLGGSGHDTFLADARSASTADAFLDFKPGDDLAVIGLNITDFKFAIADTLHGLEIDALPSTATTKIAASVILPGYTTADIGGKLSLGLSETAGNKFLFVHGN